MTNNPIITVALRQSEIMELIEASSLAGKPNQTLLNAKTALQRIDDWCFNYSNQIDDEEGT